ncbi:hypothetical protein PFY12_14630 [Chryseobacterium camelliae]|uniref:Uncharacterized protein n=1 Tax=Chryseobacterium camelliae TaxID=1265445 RepID=A0ABY7QML1_9FLAO|nr:hypothetical protein [Chryseobacterium camelliae]WBV60261.1 hypothetical protein PFY12_14630 [Chryseobacterium camelliae]
MDYSIKLKAAMAKIKDILKEYDVAAFVLLHDQSNFSEYINYLNPSYSCLEIVANGSFRFKANSSELGKEKSHEMQAATYNMVTHFSDVLGMNALNYFELKTVLQKKLGGEDGDSTHTTNTQQNN